MGLGGEAVVDGVGVEKREAVVRAPAVDVRTGDEATGLFAPEKRLPSALTSAV